MKFDQHTSSSFAQEPGRWELAYQWRVLWRNLKWSIVGVIVFLALLSIGQIYLFHRMFSDMHPALGWIFIVSVTGVFFWLVGVPFFKFLRSPRIAQPPDVNLKAIDITPEALEQRFDFDDAYLKNILQNPLLANHHEAAVKAREDIKLLRAGRGENTAGQLAEFESKRIAVLLKDLDKQVDEYIHQEALAVGSTTAISMNGSIDAFIVMWRNINMISRISRLYYGRPSMRLSLLVLRDVMVAVLLSRALDDVTNTAGDALGRAVSRLGGAVVGPLMDGSINALVTLKLGYLAKRRCRSFDVWSRSSAAEAAEKVLERVKSESSALTAEIVRISGGLAAAAGKATGRVANLANDAAGNILSTPKSAWSLVQDKFVRKPPPQDR